MSIRSALLAWLLLPGTAMAQEPTATEREFCSRLEPQFDRPVEDLEATCQETVLADVMKDCAYDSPEICIRVQRQRLRLQACKRERCPTDAPASCCFRVRPHLDPLTEEDQALCRRVLALRETAGNHRVSSCETITIALDQSVDPAAARRCWATAMTLEEATSCEQAYYPTVEPVLPSFDGEYTVDAVCDWLIEAKGADPACASIIGPSVSASPNAETVLRCMPTERSLEDCLSML